MKTLYVDNTIWKYTLPTIRYEFMKATVAKHKSNTHIDQNRLLSLLVCLQGITDGQLSSMFAIRPQRN